MKHTASHSFAISTARPAAERAATVVDATRVALRSNLISSPPPLTNNHKTTS